MDGGAWWAAVHGVVLCSASLLFVLLHEPGMLQHLPGQEGESGLSSLGDPGDRVGVGVMTAHPLLGKTSHQSQTWERFGQG